MNRLLAGLIVVGCQTSALACLNDDELPSHEREFRSQYLTQAVPARSRVEPDGQRRFWVMTGGGVGLLAGAGVLALAGGRSRS